ncbi:hypothetical protein [Streptomyces sp. NBC_01294]|uniref:hypothetical protein n=1 Tax=Streptomyces sp. NBC_01294 TaxID=2903815 RepID=UPI002DD8BB8E|nr:hypothetical protein [Streptomyces sp. NBC_01294]WRZ62309.1 hypothetical protein OG534_38270 [Streptomyces sp. NBC_01294]
MATDEQARRDEARRAAERYGEALKSLFEPALERGSSQRTLAKVLKRDAATVSRYFNAKIVAPRLFVDNMVKYLASLGVQVTKEQVESVHALRQTAQKLGDQNETDRLNDRIAALRRQMNRLRAQFSEEHHQLRNQRDALVRGREQLADALAAQKAVENARVEELSRTLASAADEISLLEESLGTVTARLQEEKSGRTPLAELVVRQQGQLEHAKTYTRDLEADLASARADLKTLNQEVQVLRRQVALLMEETRPAGTAHPADGDDATQAGASEPQYAAPVPSPTVSSDAADATQTDPGGPPYAWPASTPPATGDMGNAAQPSGGERRHTSPAPPTGGGRAASRRNASPQYGGQRPRGPWGGSAAEPTRSGREAGVPVAPRAGNTASAPRRKPTPAPHAPAAGPGGRRGRTIGLAVAILACAGFLYWWPGDPTTGALLPWNDRPTTTASPKPSPSPTPAPSPSKAPVLDTSAAPLSTSEVLALPACPSDEVRVVFFAPTADVNAGSNVRFEMILMHHFFASGSCRVDIGQHALALTIKDTAGDTVWNSADCASESPTPRWARLEDDELVKATLTWDQHTSSSTCPTATRLVPAGTYIAQASSTQAAEPSERSSFVIR